MIHIGLVVEGAHDYIMLEPLLLHELGQNGYHDVRFKYLQPVADAVGKIDRGGWPRVKAWCERYAGDQIETFFTPLFANDPPCDAIVVQMDGDTLELAGIASPPAPVSVQQRASAVASAVSGWLSLQPHRNKHVAFAVPVLQTEAWVLGAEGLRFEHADAKQEFRKSYSASGGKLSAFYRGRVVRARPGYSTICDHCDSYIIFRNSLAQLTLPAPV